MKQGKNLFLYTVGFCGLLYGNHDEPGGSADVAQILASYGLVEKQPEIPPLVESQVQEALTQASQKENVCPWIKPCITGLNENDCVAGMAMLVTAWRLFLSREESK